MYKTRNALSLSLSKMSAKQEYENNSDQVYGNGKADNATQSLCIKPQVGE